MSRGADISSGIPDALTREQLSGSVAHELNNIVAALRGFVDLAFDGVSDNPSLVGFLGEVSIGVDRATALAADLAMLAGTAGPRATVPLSQCIVALTANAGDELHVINWECDPATTVLADASQARVAAVALARLAERRSGSRSSIDCRLVAPDSPYGACLQCGEQISGEIVELSVRLPADSPRAMSGRTRGDRPRLSAMELSLAALGHAVHCSGGHLLARFDTRVLCMTLPRA